MAKTNHFAALGEIVARGLGEAPQDNASIKTALDALFGTRYHDASRPRDAYRDAYGLAQADGGVPYAGVIAPDNTTSGAYGGASLAWFPTLDGTLVTLVVGTKGLAPDEGLLTRHGHRRRVGALRQHLRSRGLKAWAKSDPAAIMTQVPTSVQADFASCGSVFKRYGDVIYSATWVPKGDIEVATQVIQAYVDLYAHERGWKVKSDASADYATFIGELNGYAFETVSEGDVNQLLRQRRFVVLQGPPGTGKTRLAERVKQQYFNDRGRTVQFHPAVTYEDFIVGLSPDPTDTGLRFRTRAGWLLEAAKAAGDAPYLLIVDEINRGDLSKVLGEAIYLFEPGDVGAGAPRVIHLPHAIDDSRTFQMPDNLFVLATMNTADRSIASLDLAVRRRFAFMTVMPDGSAIALAKAREIFEALRSVFIEHGTDEMLHLLPGHSYFLATDEAELKNRFRYELMPLLDEYLRQGLLGPASVELHAIRERMNDYSRAA